VLVTSAKSAIAINAWRKAGGPYRLFCLSRYRFKRRRKEHHLHSCSFQAFHSLLA
jgi:hypothetical protein